MSTTPPFNLKKIIEMFETGSNGSRDFLNEIMNGSKGAQLDDMKDDKFMGRNLALIIMYGLLMITALFGNILVCHVIFSRKRMRTVTNIFIANLAVSDLLLIILNVPFNIAKTMMSEWLFGSAMCHIMNMSLITSVYASTFTLTVIALDRQRVLLYPLRPRILKSGGLIMVAVIWTVSIILALPYGIYSKTREMNFYVERVLRCVSSYPSETFEQYLTVVTIILQYIAPLTVIAVTYGRIVRRIWERTEIGAVTAYQHACRSKHKKKSIKMLMLVVIVFAICWMPLNLYHILTDLHPDTETFHYDTTAFFVCHWIAISSTCYNPFIYCWLNEAFRAEIKAVFRCCCPVEISIYPRDHKMDSVSQSDSMSLQIKPRTLFSRRDHSLMENLHSSTGLESMRRLVCKHECGVCKECNSSYVCNDSWRGNELAEQADLLTRRECDD